MWRYARYAEPDSAAESTVVRLKALQHSKVLRAAPIETIGKILPKLYSVHLMEGEILVQEGDLNNDVYFILAGQLGVFRETAESRGERSSDGANDALLATFSSGEVLGEVSFFSRRARPVTMRALGASECFALKAADLRTLACADPLITFDLAATMAERFATLIAYLPPSEIYGAYTSWISHSRGLNATSETVNSPVIPSRADDTQH